MKLLLFYINRRPLSYYTGRNIDLLFLRDILLPRLATFSAWQGSIDEPKCPAQRRLILLTTDATRRPASFPHYEPNALTNSYGFLFIEEVCVATVISHSIA
ncbi:uncharacterized protein LOC143214455 [Lasioglossum baleicum]|uniref:uncharacterized protein LOC143214455 n=1 Tax=Lasioglossum baleicum TaxID=434251 RepID=UPI003FCD91CE